jgi:hypothetical protein
VQCHAEKFAPSANQNVHDVEQYFLVWSTFITSLKSSFCSIACFYLTASHQQASPLTPAR